jgi:hypothetical protein
MKKKSVVWVVLGILFFVVSGISAFAASQDECAIWLCLPSGFGEGCDGAHRAFHKRIARHKSPLPQFQECSEDDSGMSSLYTRAAFVPEHRECVEWKEYGSGEETTSKCIEWVTIPEQYIDETRCVENWDMGGGQYNNPPFCSHTVRAIKVLKDGQPIGYTYYW